ncbi:hypothetical protein ACJMK2_014818 [Sinanodonta woodiana]|uniref:Uncharacterized protein n=1 Tax=Sinanodonta woodiana TaxID=1069815 RepID=A0ABD3V316_SINWO
MRSIIVFVAIIGLSYQMTTFHPGHHTGHHTNAPHTTHEPSVQHSYNFHYDYVTHKMLVHKDRNCFVFLLTDQQRTDVHTDSGLTALEVQFLQMISTGTKTEVDKATLEHSVTQGCGNNILHYYTVA